MKEARQIVIDICHNYYKQESVSECLLDDAMWLSLPPMPHTRYWRCEALNIVGKGQDVSQGWLRSMAVSPMAGKR